MESSSFEQLVEFMRKLEIPHDPHALEELIISFFPGGLHVIETVHKGHDLSHFDR